jgi:hypothetical protein
MKKFEFLKSFENFEYDKYQKINETGEWSKNVDLAYALSHQELDGEDEEVSLILHMNNLLESLKDILKDKKINFEIEDIKGFDKYQGCYANVIIYNDNYIIWFDQKNEADDILWIEDFPINNTSNENTNPGFSGTISDIAEVIEEL